MLPIGTHANRFWPAMLKLPNFLVAKFHAFDVRCSAQKNKPQPVPRCCLHSMLFQIVGSADATPSGRVATWGRRKVKLWEEPDQKACNR